MIMVSMLLRDILNDSSGAHFISINFIDILGEKPHPFFPLNHRKTSPAIKSTIYCVVCRLFFAWQIIRRGLRCFSLLSLCYFQYQKSLLMPAVCVISSHPMSLYFCRFSAFLQKIRHNPANQYFSLIKINSP